jgi:hypothetical protein
MSVKLDYKDTVKTKPFTGSAADARSKEMVNTLKK